MQAWQRRRTGSWRLVHDITSLTQLCIFVPELIFVYWERCAALVAETTVYPGLARNTSFDRRSKPNWTEVNTWFEPKMPSATSILLVDREKAATLLVQVDHAKIRLCNHGNFGLALHLFFLENSKHNTMPITHSEMYIVRWNKQEIRY